MFETDRIPLFFVPRCNALNEARACDVPWCAWVCMRREHDLCMRKPGPTANPRPRARDHTRYHMQVWVPSTWQRDTFVTSGVEASKIRVVPEGVVRWG